jgi:hypothetical protein
MNKFITTCFFLLLSLNVFSQKINKNILNYSITYEELNNIKRDKSESLGNKQLEYNNFSFLEVLSNILDIEKSNIFISSDEAFNPKVNVKIVAKENITKQKLKKVFISFLKQNIVKSINFTEEPTTTYRLKINQLNSGSSCEGKNYRNFTRTINRTWEAKCVSLKVIKDKIHDWYGFKILINKDRSKMYSVTLYHYNSWKEFKHNLNKYTYFVLVEQKTLIKKLKITN